MARARPLSRLLGAGGSEEPGVRRWGLCSPCGARALLRGQLPRGTQPALSSLGILRGRWVPPAAPGAGGVCGVIPGEGIAGHVSAAGPPPLRDRPAGRARQQRAAGTGGRQGGQRGPGWWWALLVRVSPPRPLSPVPQPRRPGPRQGRAAPAAPQMKCENCTKKVSAAAGSGPCPPSRLAGTLSRGWGDAAGRTASSGGPGAPAGEAALAAGPKVTELRILTRGPAVTPPGGAPGTLSPGCDRACAPETRSALRSSCACAGQPLRLTNRPELSNR